LITSTAALHKDLGEVYREQGRYGEAESHLTSAIAIAEKIVGPESPDLARGLHSLAMLYWEQGRYADASSMSERTLAISQKALGSAHPYIATYLKMLGAIRRHHEAELLIKRDLSIADSASVVTDPAHQAIYLSNLAILFESQGRYADAEQLEQRALALTEKALGSQHPSVGTRLNNLAMSRAAQRHFREAEALLKRALAIEEKALGEEHPNVACTLNNLAHVYSGQGQHDAAALQYVRALSITMNARGSEHPLVGTMLSNLASAYTDQGRLADAEAYSRRALAVTESALGSEHPEVSVRLNNLSSIFGKQGRSADAEAVLRRALEISEKALGPDHPDVGLRLNNLAALAFHRQDWPSALTYYRRGAGITITRAQRALTTMEPASEALTHGEVADARLVLLHLIQTAALRADPDISLRPDLGAEMFLFAQWSEQTQAARAVSQMATRFSARDATLVSSHESGRTSSASGKRGTSN
jgi:tetratricopeptide (TPR) repeat protein